VFHLLTETLKAANSSPALVRRARAGWGEASNSRERKDFRTLFALLVLKSGLR